MEARNSKVHPPIHVLDHGYVQLIESWGSDERIIESARMSTDKGFEGWEKDSKLLSFLYKNNHLTPFEMCGVTIEVAAPIFVFREWHRHRTQSYNEMSARYIPMPDCNYVPSLDRILVKNTSNKQASSTGKELSEGEAMLFKGSLEAVYNVIEYNYQAALKDGVPKELARLMIPVGRYSKMRASSNLRNWLQFLTLRQAPNAQWEIQQYANAVGEIICQHFPRTYQLFRGVDKP